MSPKPFGWGSKHTSQEWISPRWADVHRSSIPMLVPSNEPPAKEWAVNLVLDRSSRGSDNYLKLTFYFMLLSPSDERPLRYHCTLTTIDGKGKPAAEGMEFTFIPSIVNEDGFTTDTIMGNEWIAEKKVHVDVGEDGEEVLIRLNEVVLMMFMGKCMAKAVVEESGEVLTTQNWDG